MCIFLIRTLTDYCEKKKLWMFGWMPISFVIFPPCDQTVATGDEDIMQQRRRDRKDERELLRTCANSKPEMTWIAKSSNGAKGNAYNQMFVRYYFVKCI